MSNVLLNIDQKKRLERNKLSFNPSTDDIIYGIWTVLTFVFTLIVVFAAIDQIKNNYGSNFINYDDFPISDDMKEYMTHQGHGKQFSEQDID